MILPLGTALYKVDKIASLASEANAALESELTQLCESGVCYVVMFMMQLV